MSVGLWSDTVKQKIVDFHQDELQHWVADLACGHTRHVRHDPPWQNRAWVVTEQGRREMIGFELECVECDKVD
jgi:hypothetical protein